MADLAKLVDELSALTVMEAADLSKMLEEKIEKETKQKINYYKEIESNSVGNKQDYTMHSMDFEEFLWAKGYKENQIEDLYKCMKECIPLTETQYDVMMNNFKDYMILGGMPAIVSKYIENKNFSGILNMQEQILKDYEEDIAKYAEGLDKSRILNAYRKVAVFLGNENKKFQITKITDGARNREYRGVSDWLSEYRADR